jgi:hypothetical protein
MLPGAMLGVGDRRDGGQGWPINMLLTNGSADCRTLSETGRVSFQVEVVQR